ncbi:CAP domain-containing protein [Virgibacillus kimchii]
MRLVKNLSLAALVLSIGLYLTYETMYKEEEALDLVREATWKQHTLETKVAPEIDRKFPLEGDLFQWMKSNTEALTEAFGEPDRKDMSAYGYTWWVYTDQHDSYVQFGVLENKVVTIYATGEDLDLSPIHIGQEYDSAVDAYTASGEFQFSNEVDYTSSFSSYTFILNDEDLKSRPLVKVDDDIFIQNYFDTFKNELSSIRVLTADVLLRHRPYELRYRGNLPESPNLSEEAWEEVEKGMEQQIFDITNVIRKRHNSTALSWEDDVSEVAYFHSKDMADNNYFSHTSLNGDGLKERLSELNLFYRTAGENIAAQYSDAPSAMEGWLNSEGHREALFNDEYTHLGVGVYRLYYTQNFLQKPM